MLLTHITKRAHCAKHHVAIVHRWGGNPKADWYPQLAAKLKEYHSAVDVNVHLLEMPNPMVPTVGEWTQKIKSFMAHTHANNKEQGKDQIFHFLGHSVGCNAVLRATADLATEQTEYEIGGLMLVAGWLSLNKPWHTALPWCKYDKSFFDKVKNTVADKVTLVVSDNDPYLYGEELEKNKQMFREKLGVESIVQIDGGSHFTAPEDVEHVWRVADVPH